MKQYLEQVREIIDHGCKRGDRWIPGFEGIYTIDKLGTIRNVEHIWNIKELKLDDSRRDYLSVTLFKDGRRYRFLVHRLVAEVFIPNLESKPQVNHKDGNRSNNSIDNLEWVTASENSQHALATGLAKPAVGEQYKRSHLTESDVKEIRSLWNTNDFTQIEIATRFNTSRGTINNIVNNYTWTHI